MNKSIEIGSLVINPGEKYQGSYQVEELNYEMPLTVINGTEKGKTILITAGIHGGEFVGIQAAIELANELESNQVKGSIIIIHTVNVNGFYQILPAILPEANENLNRLFPGSIEGGFGAVLAHHLTEKFQKQADFYLDLHGGDLHEEMKPFVFYPGAADEWVTSQAKEIAKVLDVEFMLKSKATTGAYNSAARLGIPSLLIERGGCGRWSKEEVNAYKLDILRALVALEVINQPVPASQLTPQDVVTPCYLESDRQGCWYPEVVAGQRVKEGQLLGEMKDLFGKSLVSFYAQMDGVVLYRTTSLAVEANAPLVAYAKETMSE